MKTSLDCLPCLLRQATDAIRLSGRSPEAEVMAVRELLLASTSLNFDQSPPQLSGTLQSQLHEITGCADPYRDAKQRFNRLARELLPPLAEAVAQSADPFAAAVRLAIAGNIIDLGAKSGLTEDEARQTAATALEQPLIGALSELREAASRARRILYLCDNAGEIVFDRVLIGQLPRGAVTVAVRGHAVINDATREDAEAAGLSDLAEVIDNGSAMPGTVLADCSPEFRRRFAEADLVIAKGQGNYESLHAERAPLFCLFRVKCAIVATHCGHPVGSHVVWQAPAI
ncbi:MAG TPA: ARMT1-like domain-containing protein [Opitutaceae bacterium]|nr:ARMT1-like domain-containing protein [Opitutaceae bacterium]